MSFICDQANAESDDAHNLETEGVEVVLYCPPFTIYPQSTVPINLNRALPPQNYF